MTQDVKRTRVQLMAHRAANKVDAYGEERREGTRPGLDGNERCRG
jgi:hypothetical protein